MKNFGLIVLLIFLFSLNANAQDAKEIFLSNLIPLEKVSENENESINLNTLYESRAFLIEITGIKFKMEEPFDMPVFPPKKTLKAWRNWFEKNKDKLFWDENSKKVKVQS